MPAPSASEPPSPPEGRTVWTTPIGLKVLPWPFLVAGGAISLAGAFAGIPELAVGFLIPVLFGAIALRLARTRIVLAEDHLEIRGFGGRRQHRYADIVEVTDEGMRGISYATVEGRRWRLPATVTSNHLMQPGRSARIGEELRRRIDGAAADGPEVR